MEWCPYLDQSQFLTFGKKHIKLWTCTDKTNWTSKNLSVGRLAMQVWIAGPLS